MLDFREITIEDKALIESYTSMRDIRTSYYNFTNLFLWRNFTNCRICEKDGFLIIAARMRDYQYCYFPIGQGDLSQIIGKIMQHFGGSVDFFPLDLAMKEELLPILGRQTAVEDCRSQYDYIYPRESLATLAGKKLHAKRNHINKFKKLYEYEYRPLTPELFGECLRLSETWWNNQENHGPYTEKEVIEDTFRYFDRLGLRGGSIFVGGEMAAFSVGEKHHGDTALIHLEKADTSYDGAFAVINQEFIQNAFEDVELVDREEDMGIAGLRKAKLSYQPSELLEIFRLQPETK